MTIMKDQLLMDGPKRIADQLSTEGDILNSELNPGWVRKAMHM